MGELLSDYMRQQVDDAAERKFWFWRAKGIKDMVANMDDQMIRANFDQARIAFEALGGKMVNGRDHQAVYQANQGAHIAAFCTTGGLPEGNLGAQTCVLPDGWEASAANLDAVWSRLGMLKVTLGKAEIKSVVEQIKQEYEPKALLYGLEPVEIVVPGFELVQCQYMGGSNG